MAVIVLFGALAILFVFMHPDDRSGNWFPKAIAVSCAPRRACPEPRVSGNGILGGILVITSFAIRRGQRQGQRYVAAVTAFRCAGLCTFSRAKSRVFCQVAACVLTSCGKSSTSGSECSSHLSFRSPFSTTSPSHRMKTAGGPDCREMGTLPLFAFGDLIDRPRSLLPLTLLCAFFLFGTSICRF